MAKFSRLCPIPYPSAGNVSVSGTLQDQHRGTVTRLKTERLTEPMHAVYMQQKKMEKGGKNTATA
jgi:hypothetical protein